MPTTPTPPKTTTPTTPPPATPPNERLKKILKSQDFIKMQLAEQAPFGTSSRSSQGSGGSSGSQGSGKQDSGVNVQESEIFGNGGGNIGTNSDPTRSKSHEVGGGGVDPSSCLVVPSVRAAVGSRSGGTGTGGPPKKPPVGSSEKQPHNREFRWIRLKQWMKESIIGREKLSQFDGSFTRKHERIQHSRNVLDAFVQNLLLLFEPNEQQRVHWEYLKPVKAFPNAWTPVISIFSNFTEVKEFCSERQAFYMYEISVALFECGDFLKDFMTKNTLYVLAPISDFVDDDFEEYMEHYKALESRRLEKDFFHGKLMTTKSVEKIEQYERHVFGVNDGFSQQAEVVCTFVDYFEQSVGKYRQALVNSLKIESEYHKLIADRLEKLLIDVIIIPSTRSPSAHHAPATLSPSSHDNTNPRKSITSSAIPRTLGHIITNKKSS